MSHVLLICNFLLKMTHSLLYEVIRDKPSKDLMLEHLVVFANSLLGCRLSAFSDPLYSQQTRHRKVKSHSLQRRYNINLRCS